MPIKFPPKVGQMFVCDFSGSIAPEINKKRPVIIVSPRLPHRPDLATIVPVSTTQPQRDAPFIYQLTKNYHPAESDDLPCWAKADLLMSVSYARLSAFKSGRGRRNYVYPTISQEDMRGVRAAILAGLRFEH